MIRESAGSRLTRSYGFTCRPVSVASVGYNTSTVKVGARTPFPPVLDGFVTDDFTVLSQCARKAPDATRFCTRHSGGGVAAAAGRRGRRAGRRQAGEASARGAVAKDGCVFIVSVRTGVVS